MAQEGLWYHSSNCALAGNPSADAVLPVQPASARDQYRPGQQGKVGLERFSMYGYRRLVCMLGENRKPIQPILQLKV
jgi:hypothetical protein